MTDREDLWEDNVAVLDKMDPVAAGSMVKQLLVDLSDIGAYIKLRDPDGREVKFDVDEDSEGDEIDVALFASELGLMVTGDSIQVPG